MAEGEERYRAVVEQAADGILLVDVDSKRVLEANAVYQDLLGYAPGEILRLTLYDLVPYPREAMDCYVRRVLEQKSYVSGERRHRRKDGSLVDVEVSANVISYSGEETLCIVVRDITERKRAAETLREVREAERRRMARDLHDGALQDLTYALAEAQII
ncbi:MAG: PAS domain S-box protein [Actinomycetota bacterium]|nr:PAS domain S-box protein [Actinomycetota bacterium]HZY66523.1 PAS domain S-box protein [Rubrobacteraceae bacterium]